MATDLTGLIPHGWAGGEAVTKWWRGKHLHLYRLRKNCAQCGKEMVLDVTKAAITGTAKNAGLHLTRCMGCREASKSEGGTSRPRTKDDPTQAAPPVQSGEVSKELESLRSWKATVTEELKSLDELRRDHTRLFQENSVLKARLAKYELAPAMEAVKPSGLGFRGAPKNKLPWE